MEPTQFRQINKDILSVVYNKKKLGISESYRKPKVIPQLEKVNNEIPYLTEQKLEEAYLSSTISDKTKKLLAWLQIKLQTRTRMIIIFMTPEHKEV